MVAHGTPSALVFDARSDRSKLSERAALKEVMLAVLRECLRPSCGNPRTHGPGRLPRLPDPSVPKPSRSSLNSKSRPCIRENACGLAQSKEFRRVARQWGWSEVLAQQNVQPMSSLGTKQRRELRRSTGRREHPVYHLTGIAVGSPFPPCSGCVIVTASDAVVGRLGSKDRTALP